MFLLFFFFFKPQISFAEVIHNFNVEILAHKNGEMDITETILYDFEESQRHGIFRYVPTYSKVGDLYRIINLKNVRVEKDGNKEDFAFSKNNEQFYLKIGDKDVTITDSHTYKIFYTVENGIGSNFQDHDEIYWNTTGNDWQVTIEKATAKVQTDFPVKLENTICYTGEFGSKEKNCIISLNTVTSDNLYPGEGLSVVFIYPVNTFPKSILSKNPPQSFSEIFFSLILNNYIYVFILLNFIVAPLLIYWYQKHKNKKRFGAPTVNFDIPKDEKGEVLRPALAGTIDTARVERDDVVATIFDLAIRKYIKLEETKTVRNLLPDLVEHKIIKLKGDDGKLNKYEKDLFDFIFATGDKVNISDLRLTFHKAFQKTEEDVFKNLVEKKYYTKNPKVQKAILYLLSGFAFLSLNFILGFILWFLSYKLNGRTSLGDEIDHKIDGLKLFLISMERNYKWQAEKFYTVEQMIPYAIALGYIDKFMEALKIIKPDYKPTWYTGYGGSFYLGYAGFYSSMSTTVAPSSSSGAGGGGSSGGGGGGGGGGSW